MPTHFENLPDFKPLGCKQCLEARPLDLDITMAFQPIIDPRDKTVFAYEALVRGVDGAGTSCSKAVPSSPPPAALSCCSRSAAGR